MNTKNRKPVQKCPYPHCDQCCGIVLDPNETDGEGIFYRVHTSRPAERPDSVRTLVERRCTRCKKYFVIENFAVISVLLRYLIQDDPRGLAMTAFRNNKDLLDKLRNDKEFMKLLLSEE